MKKLYLVTLLIGSFIFGLFAASPIKSIHQIFKGVSNVNCVSKTICVGANENVIFGLYQLDSIGGLTSIFCGKPYDQGNIEYLFLEDILNGVKCERPQYSLDFRTDTIRTNITIKDNLIIELSQGPLHTLDP